MSSTHNKQDATVSTLMQLQVQAQGTSPPAHQTALLTAPSEDEHSAVVLQLRSKRQGSKPINDILIAIAIVLIAVGTVVWVLNITNTINGPWSSVCAALFTSVGTIITLLQFSFQFTTTPTPAVTTTPLPPDTHPPDPLNQEFSIPRPSGQEGVLLVYTKKSLRGSSVDLCRGYDADGTNTHAAQNIVERKIRSHTYYIAVFQSLPPGGYTAHIYRRELMARITIYPAQVTTIDWR